MINKIKSLMSLESRIHAFFKKEQEADRKKIDDLSTRYHISMTKIEREINNLKMKVAELCHINALQLEEYKRTCENQELERAKEIEHAATKQ